MTPLKVEFENGIPILYMYSRAWDKAIINIDGNIHSEKVNDSLNIMDLFDASEADVYGDIIGDDFITKKEN